MSKLLTDYRSAIQAILRQPAVAFVILMALALGIGANIAIFPYANGLLQQAVEPDPDHLVPFHGTAGFSFSRIAGIFLLIGGAVLLVICANLAGALLSRHFPRKMELRMFTLCAGITGLIISQGWQNLLLWLPGVMDPSSFRTFGTAILATFLSSLLASKARRADAGSPDPATFDYGFSPVPLTETPGSDVPVVLRGTSETPILQNALV